MRNVVVISVCIVFAAGAIICGDVFAQRSVNSAEDAAKAARASLMNQHNRSSSQIGWLDNVVNMINMNDPAKKDIAAQNNKAIEESKGR